jgi:HK97 family phage prohead protease
MRSREHIIEYLTKNDTAPEIEGSWVVKSATFDGEIDRDERLVKGIVSVAVPDMDGEVVVPAGLDMTYFPDRVKGVFIDHNYRELPVGTCRNLSLKRGGSVLYSTTYILPGSRGDDLLTAIEHGALSGLSIGAKATDFGKPTSDEVRKYGQHDSIVRKAKLIEYSFVAHPCNQDAMIDLVSKSLIRRDSAVAFGLNDTPKRRYHSVVMGDGTCVQVGVRSC